MTIHSDKVDTGPAHALSVREVRLILEMLPRQWADQVKGVRLASGPGPRAYLFHGEGRLTIYSRGCDKRRVLAEVLSALAAPFLNITNCVARGPSREEQKRIDREIEPLLEMILERLRPEPQPKWWGHPKSLSGVDTSER